MNLDDPRSGPRDRRRDPGDGDPPQRQVGHPRERRRHDRAGGQPRSHGPRPEQTIGGTITAAVVVGEGGVEADDQIGVGPGPCDERCDRGIVGAEEALLQHEAATARSEGRDRRMKQTKIGVNLNNLDCYGQINWNVLPPAIHEALIEDFHLLMSPLNDRSKLAEDAEKDLAGLKKSEKMKERTGQIFRGLITGVQSYGFFVEIEDLLVEGLVHVSSLKDDWYEYRARHSCLVGRKNRTAYRLGNEVDVQIKSVDYYRQQIDLITVSSGVASQNTDWDEE